MKPSLGEPDILSMTTQKGFTPAGDTMQNESTHTSVILSEFAHDPDMQELVEEYVSKMSTRVEQIRGAYTSGDLESLSRLVHQLKGSGGGYGFPVVTERAHSLETTLNELSKDTLDQAHEELEALIEVCRRLGA